MNKYLKRSILCAALALLAVGTNPVFASQDEHNDIVDTEAMANELLESVVQESGNVITPEVKISVDKKTARLGDTVSFRVSGLSYQVEADDAISDHMLTFYTDQYVQPLRLQSIEIPYVYGIDIEGNVIPELNVFFMAFTDQGRSWIQDPIVAPSDDPSWTYTYTREMIQPRLDEVNNGEMPGAMWIFYDEGYGISRNVNALIYGGDMVFTFEVVDAPPYTTNGDYGFFQAYSYSRTISEFEASQEGRETRASQFVYYETSDITISSDKTEALKPGDIIELDITLKNNATHLVNTLTAYLKTNGLELVSDPINSFDTWTTYNDGLKVEYLDENGKEVLFQPQDTVTFKQKFKISESVTDATIVITPGLSVRGLDDIKYHTPLVLNLLQEVEEAHTAIVYDVNGGVGTAPTDTNTYTLNDVITFKDGSYLTKEGYTFEGWSLKATDGSLLGTSATLQDLITARSLPESLILYAQWKPVSNVVIPDEGTGPELPATGLESNTLFMSFGAIALGSLFISMSRRKNALK